MHHQRIERGRCRRTGAGQESTRIESVERLQLDLCRCRDRDNLARQGDIYAFGPLAIGGTGEIVFAGGYPYTNASLTGVTFGSGITVRNKPGAVEGGYALYANGATNNGIISSEVAGQGACLVDPLDVKSIRQGLERVINDADYRETIIEHGRKNREQFSLIEVARRYISAYEYLSGN